MTVIIPFPKGVALNEAPACLGPHWALSADLYFNYSLPCICILMCICFPVIKCMYKHVWSSIDQGFPLLVYQYLEIHLWYSNLTLNTTKPVGSKWYTSMSLLQGLTHIYLYLLLMIMWFFKSWVFWTSPYTKTLPCLHRVISNKTSYLPKSKECQGPEFL